MKFSNKKRNLSMKNGNNVKNQNKLMVRLMKDKTLQML